MGWTLLDDGLECLLFRLDRGIPVAQGNSRGYGSWKDFSRFSCDYCNQPEPVIIGIFFPRPAIPEVET